MTGRTILTPRTNSPSSSGDHNQPIDLVQKSQVGRISSDSTNASVKGVTTTFVHFGSGQLIASNAPTHVVTCKPGVRNDNSLSGTTVALVSRPSSQTSGSLPQGALNLVAANSNSSNAFVTSGGSGTLRSVSHPSSTSLTITGPCTTTSAQAPSAGYHIPRGAAVVANMTASRSQNLASIVRTTTQIMGTQNSTPVNPRTNIVSQRVVPISTSSWLNRTTPSSAVLTNKVSGTPMTGRTNITSGRSPQSPIIPITTYHGGTGKPGTIVSGSIRSQVPSAVRIGNSNDGQRPHTPKGVQISHPAHSQKYIGTGGSIRGVNASALIPAGSIGGNTVYSPTSTLVTSLASSGTTISPHPGNRNPLPNSLRLTSSSTTSVFSQVSTQSNNSLGGVSLTPSSGGTIITHQPMTISRGQSMEHHIPIKTPIVRAPHSSPQQHGIKGSATSLPACTQISFSGPKVIAQPSQGSPVAVAQISSVTTPKNTGTLLTTPTGPNTVPFQPRSGTTVGTTTSGRISGSAVSMTKVIPQVKVPQSHGSTVSIPAVVGTLPHPASSIGTNIISEPAPHTSVFLHRAPHSGIAVTTGVVVTQTDRIVSSVPQYSIATPYYFDSSNQNSFPVTAAVVSQSLNTSHYIPSTVNTATLRVGGNSIATNIGVSPIVSTSEAANHQNSTVPIIKPNNSPRPSILRRRQDLEGAPLKAAKNLTAALALPISSPPSPIRPDSRGNGNVSSGSTTISANSSPGMQIIEEDSNVSNLKVVSGVMQENSIDENIITSLPPCIIGVPHDARSLFSTSLIENPSVIYAQNSAPYLQSPQYMDGVSPRKKPRKQQLMGNELQEARSSEEDFQHPLSKRTKKDLPLNPTGLGSVAAVLESDEEDKGNWSETAASKPDCGREMTQSPEPETKRPQMSLINSYRQTWKARHNHFAKHSDVRSKEEKKRTVNEIANQKLAMQRVNGWKVMHLSGQVEDMVDMEGDVINRLQVLLTVIEKRQQPRKPYKDFDKDVNKLSELVKANIQRSIIIKDQMSDAKSQMSKIFEHRDNIIEILSKYGNKRSLRKKDKL